jgi:hypothetical protein
MAAENEMPEVNGAEVTAPTSIRFQNDLPEELKERIKAEAAKRIEELVAKDEFSINDIAQLAGVSHGSIKGRAKSLASAADIVTAVLDGARSGGTRKPSVDSVKSLLDSMTPEEKQKFLAELGVVEA